MVQVPAQPEQPQAVPPRPQYQQQRPQYQQRQPEPEKQKNPSGRTSDQPWRRPGDWACPSCDDLQFAKNAACRTCGTPKPKEAGDHVDASASFTHKTRMCPNVQRHGDCVRGALCNFAHDQEELALGKMMAEDARRNCTVDLSKAPVAAQTFLANLDIPADVVQMFLDLTEEMQEAVMARGPLHEVRNPIGVLISRVSKAKGKDGAVGQAIPKINVGNRDQQDDQQYDQRYDQQRY